jgi:hypothetical protein
MSLHEVRKRTAEKMESSSDEGTCRQCGSVQKIKTLSEHGGMCYACFSDYCRQPFRKLEPSYYATKVQAEIAAYTKRRS